ncbi:protein SCO1/2 [Solimonas aquatica]|uniref:Protein SCO1/2 n=1 Tax=Solimonas aquatica TaxID=489703 RepID=A0A1H9AA05_9GAMM|nr:SCO family protein [Solimonas aquatica]SEP73371.1 protein SCO1/2 [Solimonas aquatica]
MSVLRTAIVATLVCVAGVAVAHRATDGFAAFTLESARRLQALRAPAPVPDLALQLADGDQVRLHDLSRPVLLVDFIYTRCMTYCQALGSVYARLQQRLAPEIAVGKVQLLSVSFDPERDDPAALRAYRKRHSREATGWVLGRPVGPPGRQDWLRAFGVVVIPDGLGGYAHNAAVQVIGSDRKLVAILDYSDLDGIVKIARELAEVAPRDVAAR